VYLGGGGREQAVLLTLAGRFAGYGLRETGIDTGSSRVRVVDLKSGRVVVEAAATTPVRRPESSVNVAALVLNARGHIAWVGAKGAIVGPPTIYEVHKIDASAGVLLDSGTKIDPSSLRRHGRRISWVRGRTRRTAALN
jgi:hypothetical protein